MKPTKRATLPRAISVLLAASMLLCLASCGVPAGSSGALPDANVLDTRGLPLSWVLKYGPSARGDKTNGAANGDKTNGAANGTTNSTGGWSFEDGLPTSDKFKPANNRDKDYYEKQIKRYGEIETVVKSVDEPTAAAKNASNSTKYGTVDWSTAAQGYITFTAKGQERAFILEGPNTGVQAGFTVAKGDSIKVALVDGAGKYQYAIGNNVDGGKSYRVQYKNSFNVKTIDSDLAPFLVSTPWGDYENAPNATAKAKELWDSKKTQLENVQAIADYVDELKYDKKLKQGTIDKYVNPDSVIANGGGVCNEMAKLLTAMLRSQGVPAYYQSGVRDTSSAQSDTRNFENHAWVRVWIEASTSVKDGVTYSKGAWINVESTGGRFIGTNEYNRDYSTENNFAN